MSDEKEMSNKKENRWWSDLVRNGRVLWLFAFVVLNLLLWLRPGLTEFSLAFYIVGSATIVLGVTLCEKAASKDHVVRFMGITVVLFALFFLLTGRMRLPSEIVTATFTLLGGIIGFIARGFGETDANSKDKNS